MGELLDYFKDRYAKNRSKSKDLLQRQRVKNSIAELCGQYLVNVGDEFTFEVLPRDLHYAIEVINEEPLNSNFIIRQVDDTLFVASIREIIL